MPVVDFSKVEEIGEFSTIPDGTYAVEVHEVKEKKTNDGQYDMFNLTLKVLEGEYEGRYIFDNMTFKPGKPMQFVKHVVRALGIMDDKFNLTADSLIERQAIVEVIVDEYPSDNGTKKNNKVKPGGWSPIDGQKKPGGNGQKPSSAPVKNDTEQSNIPFYDETKPLY